VVGIEVRPAAFLELFLGLVADARAASSADRATDDRARGSRDGTAEDGPCGAASERSRAGARLVVTLGSLAGDRTADSADSATDHGARRATDCCPDRGARQSATTGTERLGAPLTTVVTVVVDHVAAIHRTIHVIAVEIRVERVDVTVDAPRVVPIHKVAS
jgi:hypothetical protein